MTHRATEMDGTGEVNKQIVIKWKFTATRAAGQPTRTEICCHGYGQTTETKDTVNDMAKHISGMVDTRN